MEKTGIAARSCDKKYWNLRIDKIRKSKCI